MSGYDIYGLGAALVDTEIDVSEDDLIRLGIQKGVMTLVDEERQHELMTMLDNHLCHSTRASGGSAANSIIAAQYLGGQTFYSCKVADDDNGRFYLADLSAAGVHFPQHAGEHEGITGKCLVMITADAERTMNTFLGISETLSSQQIDEEALKRSKYVYIEGYLVTSTTGKPAAIKLRQLAEHYGVKTSVSLSDPAIVEFFYDDLKEMVGEKVDILFCNEAEAMKFTRTDTLEKALAALQETARSFAVTRGAAGAVVFDGESYISVDAPSVNAVDTNGAGDMFAGAFMFAITQGRTYKAAAQLAVKASALVVSQYGPRLASEQYAQLV